MNLGDANLRVVHSSRPALVHSASKQSVTASDDYYSLSSGNSSQDEKSAVCRYQTPPLHIIPEPHRRTPEADSTKPTVRAVTPTPLKLPIPPETAKLAGPNPTPKIKRKPVSAGSTSSEDGPSNQESISPPTPGLDDTPYIQFAIEQLTRDEEVEEVLKSQRLHSAPSRESYSVERIIPDERLRLQQGLQSGDRRQQPLQPTRQSSDASVGDEDVWKWTAVEPIGWTLLALYILLIIALVLLILKLRRDPSGLRWDPRSLADILSLFQRSNILSDFYGSETRAGSTLTALPKKYTLRYWIAGKRSSEIFHGIEESQTALHGFRHKRGSNEKSAQSPLDLESQRPLKTSTLDSLQKDVHSPRIRYRWLPWFLTDTFVVAWTVIAIVLMLAFVVVSFVNNATRGGFVPKLTSMKTSQGFSPADFLYSFIPCIIGMILFLAWQPIDMYFRALQPFANLSHTRGGAADESLLLDYTACLPVEVTIKAALAGHYKVAWISFISLLSATLPVLSGGVFTAQYFIPRQEVRVAASMSGYYALVAFVIIYSLSFLVVWPRQKRRLPHDIRTLGQLLSFVYESRLLNDAVFWQPRSRIDLVTRLLGTLTGDRGSSRYAFGVYMGRDGREHLGIDRLSRPESGEMFIATGKMR
ncbi:MAG: hypothetical protein Q9213_005528 [Squamulea squamosa]